MEEKKQYTCTHPSCKTTFTTPLKTMNLQANPSEPYFACPFCLTKIEEEALNLKLPSKEAIQKEEDTKTSKPEDLNTGEKSTQCKYHMGYLGERQNNGQIPDECLVCKDIIDCMLKRVHT